MTRTAIGWARVVAAAALLAAALGGCSSDDGPPPPPAASMFAVPASLDELSGATFFDHPFPSDVRRDADGTARFAGFPNPYSVRLLTEYIDTTKGLLRGFSPVSAAYLRFTSPLDASSLPAEPPATLAPDASVQIVDVDPASPERGKKHLAQVRVQTSEGIYIPSATLAVMPMIGAPLRPKTKYAVVVTSRVRAEGGAPVVASPELEEVLGLRDASERTRPVRELYAPAVEELVSSGIALRDIVHLTVFTTNDPTEETFAAMDDVVASTPAPAARDWTRKDDKGTYDVYEGVYGPSPVYQVGTPPYRKPADGGSFAFESGKPKTTDTVDLRFALAVPNVERCPAPTAGYPVVLYAHGTGGDYRSFIADGTARALADRCLASMGIDQVLHGTRKGAPPEDDPNRDSTIELMFFNFENPLAARTHNRQSAVDVVQQARLFTEAKVTIPASVSKTSAPIAFDGTRVTFFGHSQGGLNGPLFLAGSDLARGGVLSGAGSIFGIALLQKTKPVDIPAAVRFLARLSTEEEAKELDLFHPIITLAQTMVDVSDPINYARAIVREPRAGRPPKSIYQTEGVAPDGSGDTYTPPKGIEALAVAIGLPRIAPGVRPIDEAIWAGLADVTVPPGGLSGNLAQGRATGALAQFVPPAGRDGHFVVFNVPAAQSQAARFCEALAADPVGRVSP